MHTASTTLKYRQRYALLRGWAEKCCVYVHVSFFFSGHAGMCTSCCQRRPGTIRPSFPWRRPRQQWHQAQIGGSQIIVLMDSLLGYLCHMLTCSVLWCETCYSRQQCCQKNVLDRVAPLQHVTCICWSNTVTRQFIRFIFTKVIRRLFGPLISVLVAFHMLCV